MLPESASEVTLKTLRKGYRLTEVPTHDGSGIVAGLPALEFQLASVTAYVLLRLGRDVYAQADLRRVGATGAVLRRAALGGRAGNRVHAAA